MKHTERDLKFLKILAIAAFIVTCGFISLARYTRQLEYLIYSTIGILFYLYLIIIIYLAAIIVNQQKTDGEIKLLFYLAGLKKK